MSLIVYLIYSCALKYYLPLSELKNDCADEFIDPWVEWGIDYKDAEEVKFFLEDYER